MIGISPSCRLPYFLPSVRISPRYSIATNEPIYSTPSVMWISSAIMDCRWRLLLVSRIVFSAKYVTWCKDDICWRILRRKVSISSLQPAVKSKGHSRRRLESYFDVKWMDEKHTWFLKLIVWSKILVAHRSLVMVIDACFENNSLPVTWIGVVIGQCLALNWGRESRMWE